MIHKIKKNIFFLNPQLSLTESELSKIGTIRVEAIINPTNAEMDLKDGVGEKDIFICILFCIKTFNPFSSYLVLFTCCCALF